MILSLAHITFFAACAWYLCTFYPEHALMVLSLAGAGLLAEISAWPWRRFHIPEVLLVVIGVAVYAVWQPTDREGWHCFIGMGMACWLLVPSRHGWLRYLVPLAALEMLFLIISRDAAFTRVASLAVVPICVGALAVDSWMWTSTGARASMRHRRSKIGMLRWALLPAALAATVGLAAGLTLSKNESPGSRPRTTSKHPGPGNIASRIDLDGLSISRDPGIAARLNWDEVPPPPGIVYLRAMALPKLACDQGHVTWDADTETYTPVSMPTAPDTAKAYLYRAAGGGDVVFRPEGRSAVDLDGLLIDPEENLYRVGFGQSPHVYRVGLDGRARVVRANSGRDYLAIPAELRLLPWERIEGHNDWRTFTAENAAAAICRFLSERCDYRTQNLPAPASSPGGALRTFLFGGEAERVGHCQYFATAAVILLRRAGHQSRCVIGFASNERDGQGVVFRGMHAHAWIEVVDSFGVWRRFDPTPSQPLMDQQNIDMAEQATKAETPTISPVDIDRINQELAKSNERQHTRWRLAASAGSILALLAAWRWLRRPHRDRRLLELERRTDDLFRLAVDLGVQVTPATTVTMVAETLGVRTGIDLSRCLRAHLEARYGTGPMPEPWPISELKQAAKRLRAHA